ncbi:NUDIX domain-containing protein [Arthrobacter bambusae]|uniref:NUDIX domain-containing protein n=1 Tax=Arthrobacter bambusae TaxID=1338426 RepID=UPI0027888C25|nr:NUDIX domain-containing protein [Arthrobacter bambusae]MDQ0031785.1 putative NUDIX family NTP pyrophosphohydrolase [Arthrobacter bambusae]MDQ0099937.1 putative NUDIX family NTP pyrophosphohydrolase [Arthrobacter bambusae]
MAVRSAGILLYRRSSTGELEVWIAHMGGPFWARKDERAWSIPKGEYLDIEDPLVAAKREFAEEMGVAAPAVDFSELGIFRQPSGKLITAFAAETDFAPEKIVSNTFELEWPRGSGLIRSYPEIDNAMWATEAVARTKLVKGQVPILDALVRRVGSG